MARVVSGKYELLEVLHDEGIRSYRARQVTLGHILMVHFIPGSQRGDDLALLDRLAKLPDSARKLFFDAGEHNSVPYVVSWPLPEFDSLPGWLNRTIERDRQHSIGAAAPKPQSGDPSEFTRMFFKGMKEPAGPPPNDAPAPQNVKEAPPLPKEPGEFTRFFQAPDQAPAAPKPAVDPLPAPARKEPPAPLGSGPGEFTQFFQGPAPTGSHLGPAENELFKSPPLFPAAARSPARPLDTADVAPPPAPPPLPKPPAPVPSAIQAPAVAIPPVPKPPAAPASPEPIMADDYANVIARHTVPALPPPPVAVRKPAVAFPQVPRPQLPQVPRPPSSPYLPMWITLAVLFVLAVVLTLILALTR